MLPVNVLRLPERPWEPGGEPGPPFQTRGKPIGGPLPLTTLGAHLEEIAAGSVSCPLHAHTHEEEVFLVIEGRLRARELEADRVAYREIELRAGDLVVYPPGTGLAHQFLASGDGPAVFLALSSRHAGDLCTYPDSGKTALRALDRVGVWEEGGPPELQIAAARWAASERVTERFSDLPHVVRSGAVPFRRLGEGPDAPSGRQLSATGGATAVFVNQDRLPQGGVSSPLHWHRFEEELLLVQSGRPLLRQVRKGIEERVQLEPGDVVHWGPGDKVAHQILNEDPEPAGLLVVGTHLDHDLVVFPELGRIASRALAVSGTFVDLDYWTGERD